MLYVILCEQNEKLGPTGPFLYISPNMYKEDVCISEILA